MGDDNAMVMEENNSGKEASDANNIADDDELADLMLGDGGDGGQAAADEDNDVDM